MSRRTRLAVVVGVLAVAVLATAGPAGAYRTDWYESLTGDQRLQVREFVRWMGPYEPVPPVNEAPVGREAAYRAWQSMQAMKPSVASTPAKRTAWQRAQTMLYRAASKAKVLATPAGAAAQKVIFGVASGTTYVIGAWEIGSYLNRKFFRIGVNTGPEQGPVEAFAFHPVDEGDQMLGAFWLHMPFDGFQVWWQQQGYSGWIDRYTSLAPDCNGDPIPSQPLFARFAGEVDVGPIDGSAFCGYTPPEPIYAPGETRMVAIPPYVIDPPQPYVPSEHDPLTNGPMPTVPDPSDQTIDEALEDLLERPESDDLRGWVDHQLQPEQAEYDPYAALERTAQVLDNPAYITEGHKRRKTEEIINDCGEPIFHYTSPGNAASIWADRKLIASGENPPYPAGAFATTITPLDPGRTQRELSDHLFQDPDKPSSAWVLFCSRHNPGFRPIPPPEYAEKPDYRYIPDEAGERVNVVPEAIGVNPMDYE